MILSSTFGAPGSRLAILKVVLICGFLPASLSACAPDVDQRITHAYSLARRPTPRNKDRIEAMAHDPDRDVRATALVLLQTLDAERASRVAMESLQDPDGLVRAAAATIVGASADAATIQALAPLAESDPVWQVRARVLDAIAASEDPAVKERFGRALTDPVRHVRRAALRAGIAHPGLLPIDTLSKLVTSDPDWENRLAAAQALGASKDPAAVEALEAARTDPNEFVRLTAARERRALGSAAVP